VRSFAKQELSAGSPYTKQKRHLGRLKNAHLDLTQFELQNLAELFPVQWVEDHDLCLAG